MGKQSVAENRRQSKGTLVLLHAAGLDRSVWQTFSDCMPPSGWDVLALDLIGHGEERNPETLEPGNILETMTDAVGRQLETLAKPIVVMGMSVGGVVAQMLAIRQVQGICALVLCGTLFDPSEGVRDALRQRAAHTRALGAEALVDETVSRWFPSEFLEKQARTVLNIRNVLRHADTEVLARIWDALSTLDLRSRIDQIKLPTLVLCGAEDQAAPPADNKDLADLLAYGSYLEFAGAGHLVPIERPIEAASVVSHFITSEG